MKFKVWLVSFVVVILALILLVNRQSVDIKKVTEQKNMKIESSIFANNENIPTEYTCYGKGTQVPLEISEVPKGAKSLALIVDDPDASGFVHWIIWNIDPKTSVIENGIAPEGSIEGYTSLGKPGFVAPCPPSGLHHYNFKLYALDTVLSIPKSSNKANLVLTIGQHILDSAILVGLYQR